MIKVQYINHASFLISYRNTNIIIDPFLSGKFFWMNDFETQLTKPKIKFNEIPKIDAILCTHIHGDHFDIETILKFIERDKPLLIAPSSVVNFLINYAGINTFNCIIAIPNKKIRVKKMTIISLPNKGNEKDIECNRFSFVVECGKKRIFHSGDSHGFSNEWERYIGKIDLACLWIEKTEEIIRKLKPNSVCIHHFERFSPGNFSCNKNPIEIIKLLKKGFHNIKFYNTKIQDTIIL